MAEERRGILFSALDPSLSLLFHIPEDLQEEENSIRHGVTRAEDSQDSQS